MVSYERSTPERSKYNPREITPNLRKHFPCDLRRGQVLPEYSLGRGACMAVSEDPADVGATGLALEPLASRSCR